MSSSPLAPAAPDVIIVGAGIIGASLAWRLAQAGITVVLMDAGAMGQEASAAGAGMLAPGAELTRSTAWADLANESLRGYPEFVAELQEETGVRIDYRACGGVDLAFDPDEEARFSDRRQMLAAAGVTATPLMAGEVKELVPDLDTHRLVGALHYPTDALVDPRDVMRSLREACLSRGVRLREHCAVRRLDASSPAIRVITETGEQLEAQAAVLAAGAWSTTIEIRGVLPSDPLSQAFPVKGHLIGYDMHPGFLGPVVRHGHTYLLQRSSGFTVAGSSEERVGFDRQLSPAMVADIARRAAALLPPLAAREPSRCWVGFRPATESFQPEVRRLESASLWLAYGHYRNGILLAPATARRLCCEIISSLGKR